MTGFFLMQSITDIVMNNTNVQGKSYKVAATQEMITAQNSANQGNEYFNGINQEELEGVCEILSKLWSKPGSLQFRPNYFENYLKMADGFVRSARTSADKKNMVLNAIGFLCAAILDTNKSEDEPGVLETPTGMTTGKRMKDRVKDLETALNEWAYVDGGTLDFERGPHTEIEDWERDKEKIRRLGKKCADELLEDVEGMIKVISEVYGI